MAKEFKVPFLGSVPIDPQFVMLVETGKRPVYPVGTKINGSEFNGNGESSIEQRNLENGARSALKDPGHLVVKYQDCSLSPIFKIITEKVIATSEGREENHP